MIDEIKQTVLAYEHDISTINVDKLENEMLLESTEEIIMELSSLESDMFKEINSINDICELTQNTDILFNVGSSILGIPATESDESLGTKLGNLIRNIIEFIKKGFMRIVDFIRNIVIAIFGLKSKIKKKIKELKKTVSKYQKEGRVNLIGNFPKHIKEILLDMFKITLLYENKLDSEAINNFITKQKHVVKHDTELFTEIIFKYILKDIKDVVKKVKNINIEDKNQVDELTKSVVTLYHVVSNVFQRYSTSNQEIKLLLTASEYMFGKCDQYVKGDSCYYDLTGLQTNNVRLLDIYSQKNKDNDTKINFKVITLNEIMKTDNKAREELKKMYKDPGKLEINPLTIEEILTFLDLWENTLLEIDPAINITEKQFNKLKKEIEDILNELEKYNKDIYEKAKDNNNIKDIYNIINNIINYIRTVGLNVMTYYSSGLYATIRSVYTDYYLTYINLSLKLMTK